MSYRYILWFHAMVVSLPFNADAFVVIVRIALRSLAVLKLFVPAAQPLSPAEGVFALIVRHAIGFLAPACFLAEICVLKSPRVLVFFPRSACVLARSAHAIPASEDHHCMTSVSCLAPSIELDRPQSKKPLAWHNRTGNSEHKTFHYKFKACILAAGVVVLDLVGPAAPAGVAAEVATRTQSIPTLAVAALAFVY